MTDISSLNQSAVRTFTPLSSGVQTTGSSNYGVQADSSSDGTQIPELTNPTLNLSDLLPMILTLMQSMLSLMQQSTLSPVTNLQPTLPLDANNNQQLLQKQQ